MLTPRYVQDSETLIKAAKRILNYRKDVAAPDQLAAARAGIVKVRKAIKQRSAPAVKEAEKPLVEILTKIDPPRSNSWIRDNVELIVVVVAIALGLRAFYLQPFKIPTGSMQPTLNGIIAKPIDGPAPNFLVQAFQFVVLGRTYADVVSEEDNDGIVDISPVKLRWLWDGSLIRMSSGRAYTVGIAPDILKNQFGVFPFPDDRNSVLGKKYRKGEPIVRGYADLGDQVFVDKFSYNFVHPHRADIFVFKTNGIPIYPQRPDGPSEHFIKRLAGTPGDTLRIAEPNLFINGQPADNFAFKRVASRQNGYTGYTNGNFMRYLSTPSDTVTIPPYSYFALGDNSANSLDSRYWGFVPADNVVGRGLFVYWPFTSHWGFPR